MAFTSPKKDNGMGVIPPQRIDSVTEVSEIAPQLAYLSVKLRNIYLVYQLHKFQEWGKNLPLRRADFKL